MTALSSGNLYQPLLVGTAHIQRLDDFMWPTYNRVSLEQGGDHVASFSLSPDTHDINTATLERWFLNWIGCHFEESYGGVVVFQGYVHALRIFVGGVERQITLDDMYNRVFAQYQADSSASKAATGSSEDADSVARYGARVLEYDGSPTYIAQTHAEAIRDQLLEWHAWPRSSSGDVATYDRGTSLEVEIRGYCHTVNWLYYQSASQSTTGLSTHISSTLLSGLDFVTAGTIATISTTITLEADHIRRLDRIKTLLENEDYKWGCFAGRTFEVTARDLTTIKYRRRAYGDRYGFTSGGRYVPEPLITPGGWLYTEDIFAGSGPDESDLRDDVRADWLFYVEYSRDGITISNPTWHVESSALALEGELKDTYTTNRLPHVERYFV